jgi:predicted DNA-binding protein
MSVKTVRFNSKEEKMLKSVLHHYGQDFSTCIKELIAEKMEDLLDIGILKRIREGKPSSYLTASQIDAGFRK